MKLLDVERILDRREIPWFYTHTIEIEGVAFRDWIGVPPVVRPEDGFGDADHWAVELDCGLKLAFQFIYFGRKQPLVYVFASEPINSHAERHLKEWQFKFEEIPPEPFAEENAYIIKKHADSFPGLLELDAYQVWRQGDDGNSMKVGNPTSKLDAECWANELESHGHKQIYWVSRVDAQ